MTNPITNTDDIIDSRDVIRRLDELETVPFSELDEDEKQELTDLRDLADDGETNVQDWQYGEVLIRDSHFEIYARELAEDIGAIDPNAEWPLGHIDWTAAAEALKVDYVDLDFAGETYWARA